MHALVGTMSQQSGQLGHRDGPIYEALPFASMGAGYLAVMGILSAVYRRLDDGVGRLVETSLFDGALAYHSILWGETGREPTAHPELRSAWLVSSGVPSISVRRRRVPRHTHRSSGRIQSPDDASRIRRSYSTERHRHGSSCPARSRASSNS